MTKVAARASAPPTTTRNVALSTDPRTDRTGQREREEHDDERDRHPDRSGRHEDRQQGHDRADRECCRRGECRVPGADYFVLVDSEFRRQVRRESVALCQLTGDRLGSGALQTTCLPQLGEFLEFGDGVVLELAALLLDERALAVLLAADRYVLPQRHRHGAADQRGDTGGRNRGDGGGGAGDADHDRSRRDDAVVRACSAPGLMEALNSRADERHGSTEEVPGGASGAGGGSASRPDHQGWRVASDR